MKTITISDETYELLTKEKGKLITEKGENLGFDETIEHLIKNRK